MFPPGRNRSKENVISNERARGMHCEPTATCISMSLCGTVAADDVAVFLRDHLDLVRGLPRICFLFCTLLHSYSPAGRGCRCRSLRWRHWRRTLAWLVMPPCVPKLIKALRHTGCLSVLCEHLHATAELKEISLGRAKHLHFTTGDQWLHLRHGFAFGKFCQFVAAAIYETHLHSSALTRIANIVQLFAAQPTRWCSSIPRSAQGSTTSPLNLRHSGVKFSHAACHECVCLISAFAV